MALYRIVHFATHGVLDSRLPERSGLVLSRVDEQGRPQEGFLGLGDIDHLRLGADLVVLSGCETALGKAVHGPPHCKILVERVIVRRASGP